MLAAFTPAHLPALMDLQQHYAQCYPGVPVIPGELYLAPAFHGGEDVLCLTGEGGRLLGYAVVYAQLADADPPGVHTVWAELRADPALPDPGALKERLWPWLMARARMLAAAAPGYPARLAFQYLPVESPSIAYVTGRGAVHHGSIFRMGRNLAEPITLPPAPPGVTVRRWRMPSEAEQLRFLAARAAIPEAAKSLPDWQYFMQSAQWAVGATWTAFAPDGEVAGSVLFFWDPAEQARTGVKSGQIDLVFVQPEWRCRGIARHLLSQALTELRGRGRDHAQLEVRALNREALRLYRGCGFEVVGESGIYTLPL